MSTSINQSGNKNYENSESIILENSKNQKHRLTISNNLKYIQFIIEDLLSALKKDYILFTTLEELQKINRYFLFFKDTQEANQILIKTAKEKYLSIVQEEDKCLIKIINKINNEEFTIDVPKNENKKQDNLIYLFSDIQKRLENLEKENIELKQKNSNLEKKINEMNKRLIILEKGLVNNEIQEIKNYNRFFKSNIINEHEEKLIKNWIQNRIESAELLFDTSRDSDTINAFKNKCEGQSPTLIIVKTDQGIIFGGYATSKWQEGGPIEDYNSFIFSFNPEKKYKVINTQNALFGYRFNDIIFQFGCCGFRIAENCTRNNNNYISFSAGSYYEEGFKDIIKGDNNRDKHFSVNRIEIFKLSF